MENKQSDNGLTVPQPIINDRGLAFAVYVLYLVVSTSREIRAIRDLFQLE
jgi:hypothetical protein